jgi:hypothetical protein
MEAHRVVRRRGSHVFWTIGSHMAVRLSAVRPGRPLLPGMFLAGRIRSSEVSNDLIGNRTSDLPAGSIVRQPTALPRAPFLLYYFIFIILFY